MIVPGSGFVSTRCVGFVLIGQSVLVRWWTVPKEFDGLVSSVGGRRRSGLRSILFNPVVKMGVATREARVRELLWAGVWKH
jgi:hypothetical protein